MEILESITRGDAHIVLLRDDQVFKIKLINLEGNDTLTLEAQNREAAEKIFEAIANGVI